jgi:hypothetical protein
MLKKVALLVAALLFAVPVFAQTTTPGADAPAAAQDAKPAKKHHKSHKSKKAKKADKADKEAAPQ